MCRRQHRVKKRVGEEQARCGREAGVGVERGWGGAGRDIMELMLLLSPRNREFAYHLLLANCAYFIAKYTQKTHLALIYVQNMYNLRR